MTTAARGAPDDGASGRTPGRDARRPDRASGGAGADAGDGPEGDVRCKLLRGDGSEWTVTELSLATDGFHVSAYRYVREGHVSSESHRETLSDELLASDDRVWCLDRRGSVVWALHRPDDQSVHHGADGAADVG